MLSQRDLGTLIEPEKISLNTFLDRWLEISAKPRVKAASLQSYRQQLRLYIQPGLGEKELSKLQPFEIQEIYGELISRGLSSRTVRYAHGLLKDALDQAVKWRVLQSNPTSFVDLPRHKKVTQIIVFTEEEAQRFLSHSRANHYHALFSLLLSTGLRPSEALGLLWTDVDFQRLELRVQRKLTRIKNGKEWELEPTTKTKSSRRVVTFPDALAETLQAHRESQPQNPHNLVFTDPLGDPCNGHAILNQEFRPELDRAGLNPKMRLYDLRHSHATLLLLAGIHPKTVCERLGHSSVKITLDTYSHVLPSLQKLASEAMETMLFTGHLESERAVN